MKKFKKEFLSLFVIGVFCFLAAGSTGSDEAKEGFKEGFEEGMKENSIDEEKFNDDKSNDIPEELTEETSETKEDQEINQDAIWLLSIAGSVFPDLQEANSHFMNASSSLENIDIVTAGDEFKISLKQYKEVKEKLNKIKSPTDENLSNANKSLNDAIDKFITSLEGIVSGLEVMDLDSMTEALEVYNKGTVDLNKANDAIEKFNELNATKE